MKKEDLKMTKDMHGQDKHCGVCHNGKKSSAGKGFQPERGRRLCQMP